MKGLRPADEEVGRRAGGFLGWLLPPPPELLLLPEFCLKGLGL